jgi:hypothetical protein
MPPVPRNPQPFAWAMGTRISSLTRSSASDFRRHSATPWQANELTLDNFERSEGVSRAGGFQVSSCSGARFPRNAAKTSTPGALSQHCDRQGTMSYLASTGSRSAGPWSPSLPLRRPSRPLQARDCTHDGERLVDQHLVTERRLLEVGGDPFLEGGGVHGAIQTPGSRGTAACRDTMREGHDRKSCFHVVSVAPRPPQPRRSGWPSWADVGAPVSQGGASRPIATRGDRA